MILRQYNDCCKNALLLRVERGFKNAHWGSMHGLFTITHIHYNLDYRAIDAWTHVLMYLDTTTSLAQGERDRERDNIMQCICIFVYKHMYI